MEPRLATIVERHVGAWAHAEHGLGLHVYTAAQRDTPTNMINNAIAVGAVRKLRFAQDLVLYNLEVGEEIGPSCSSGRHWSSSRWSASCSAAGS